jgi:hypothetical protein
MSEEEIETELRFVHKATGCRAAAAAPLLAVLPWF